MLDKLQKQICRAVGSPHAASVEPLARFGNVASLVFSIGITLVDVYLNRLSWFHFILEGVILIDCMIFVTIPRCYKDVYVSSFFPRTATLWTSLPIECFPLTYDVSGFKSSLELKVIFFHSKPLDAPYSSQIDTFFKNRESTETY